MVLTIALNRTALHGSREVVPGVPGVERGRIVQARGDDVPRARERVMVLR